MPLAIVTVAVLAGVIYYLSKGRMMKEEWHGDENTGNDSPEESAVSHDTTGEPAASLQEEQIHLPEEQEILDLREEDEPPTLTELCNRLLDLTEQWCHCTDKIKAVFQDIIGHQSHWMVDGKAYVSFSDDPISTETLAVEIEFSEDESAMTIEGITGLFTEIQSKGFIIRRTKTGKGFGKGRKSLVLFLQ